MRTCALAATLIFLGALCEPSQAQLQTQGTTVGAPRLRPQTSSAILTLIGAVSAIGRRSFVCRWKNGTWSFVIGRHTQFFINGVAAEFASLQIGDRVSVRYQTLRGRKIARTVEIAR
jgi:hypothetical protein